MKSLPLLLTFPVLLPLCTLQAASPLDREDGRITLRDNGRKTTFRVLRDEVHRSTTDGGSQSVGVRGLTRIREVIREAKALQAQTGDPVDLIAYEDGKPQTEANKRLITKRLLVKLAEGVDPVMIMDATGAAAYTPLVFSPGSYQYFYSGVDQALDVAELLRSVDGVLEAEVLLAKKLKSARVPTDPFFLFSTASAVGGPVTQTAVTSHINDDMVYERMADVPANLPPPWRYLPRDQVKPYQWYLNNTGEQIQLAKIGGWPTFDPPLPPVDITGTQIDNTFTTAAPHGFRTGDAVIFGLNMIGGSGLEDDNTTRYFISTVPTARTFTVSTSARPGSPVNFGSNITKGTVRHVALNPLRGRTIVFPSGAIEPLGEDIGDQLVDINVTPVWGTKAEDGKPSPEDPGIFGNNVTVAIVDQGVNLRHTDLNKEKILFAFNRNYLEPNKTDPKLPNRDANPPTKGENHGTACAGVIFSRHDNSLGLAGIAPEAKMLAIRIIGGFVTPVDMASAMIEGVVIDNTDPQNPKLPSGGKIQFDISSNSWGISQNGSGLVDEDKIFKDALKFGVQKGRLQKGVVYVFAAGNEGDYHENTNYSYPANSPYTLVVGGVTDNGRRVSYSNPGASLAVVAPTKGDELPPRIRHEGNQKFTDLLNQDERPSATKSLFPRYPYQTVKPEDIVPAKRRSSQGILTLDNQTTASDGVGRYNPNFDGTSAATPQVSGVAALVIEAATTAGKELGWRDVQEILMRSAYPVDFTSPMDDPLAVDGRRGFGQWVKGPLGNYMSHIYGYGCVNAEYAVRMAKVWTPMGGQNIKEITVASGGAIIQDFTSQANPRIIPLQPPLPGVRLERVQVSVRVQHGRRGDLGITLISPAVGQSGADIESELFVPHREDFGANIGNFDLPEGQAPTDADYWTFTTVRNWGARYGADGVPVGTFGLKVWDNSNMGANLKPTAANPVYVPVVNPPASGTKVTNIKVTYYGSLDTPKNDPPIITTESFAAALGQPYANIGIKTKSDQPIENYTFRFIGPEGSTTRPHPNDIVDSPPPDRPNPEVMVNPKTGLLGWDNPDDFEDSPLNPELTGTWTVEIGATNVFGTTLKRVPLVVKAPTTYTMWRQLNFTASQLNDPKIGGHDSDPDRDGVPNVLEFTMGTNPWAKQNPDMPSTTVEGNEIVVRYQRDINALGGKIEVETSVDLKSWVDSTQPKIEVNGTLEIYEFRLPIGDGKKFVRLKGSAT